MFPNFYGQPIYRQIQPIYYNQLVTSQPVTTQPVTSGNQYINYNYNKILMMVTPINPISPEQYLTQNRGFIAYKSAGDYIITLGIPNTAKTNMNRNSVVDKNYAKFRTNCADVLKIELKNPICEFKDQTIDSIRSDHDKNFIYKLNTQIKCKFDEDINEICTTGIHFYLSRESAYFHHYYIKTFIPKEGPYTCKSWYDNGEKWSEKQYLDGDITLQTEWYENGYKSLEINYKNDLKHGTSIYWYDNGKKSLYCNYLNGKLDGLEIKWWSSGHIKYENRYKDGLQHGISLEYHKDGKLKSSIEYNNNNIQSEKFFQ